MTVRFAPRALIDIEDIRSYLLEHSPLGAERVRLALVLAIDQLDIFPESGAKTDEPNLYRRPLSKYPYTIFYRLLAGDDGIEIARVIHGARVKQLGRMPDVD